MPEGPSFEIDEETGLPVLPEGQFWSVREMGWHGIQVALMTRMKYDYPGERSFWDIIFFRKVPNQSRMEDIRIDSRILQVDDIDGERKNLKLSEITPEIIRNTAIRILDNRAKIRAAHNLLGDYPPKKLEI